jgi:hypothetical protein
VKGVLLGIAIALLMVSCVVNRLMGPRLTGTCDGACNRYVECKAGSTNGDRDRCRAECPEVFSDNESLMAFESLSCTNAVEYIDGKSPKAATRK